jgi:hypothetical protein
MSGWYWVNYEWKGHIFNIKTGVLVWPTEDYCITPAFLAGKHP